MKISMNHDEWYPVYCVFPSDAEYAVEMPDELFARYQAAKDTLAALLVELEPYDAALGKAQSAWLASRRRVSSGGEA